MAIVAITIYVMLNVLVFVWSLHQDHRDFTRWSWILSTVLALTVGAPLVIIVLACLIIKDVKP